MVNAGPVQQPLCECWSQTVEGSAYPILSHTVFAVWSMYAYVTLNAKTVATVLQALS